MPDTVVGLFRTRSEAEAALGKLKQMGFGDEEVSVSTPRTRRQGHYLGKHLAGLAAGALIGAVVGGLIGILPPARGLVHGGFWLAVGIAVIAGAVTGAVAGGLFSMAASGDRALYYEQEVESGRFLLSVTGPRLEEAWVVMREMGAMEAAPVEAPIERGRPRPESG